MTVVNRSSPHARRAASSNLQIILGNHWMCKAGLNPHGRGAFKTNMRLSREESESQGAAVRYTILTGSSLTTGFQPTGRHRRCQRRLSFRTVYEEEVRHLADTGLLVNAPRCISEWNIGALRNEGHLASLLRPTRLGDAVGCASHHRDEFVCRV